MNYASVSVVIPCYKSSSTIERAVRSVERQTLRPLEVILVDDSSLDGSLKKLEELRDSHPRGWITVIEMDRNMGPGSARNRGWEVARGDYIAFLDSDDSWHPRKIEVQYEWMKKHPEVSLSGHNYSHIQMDGSVFSKQEESTLSEVGFSKVSKISLLRSNVFSTPTVMLKKDLPFRFEDGRRFSEDYQLWLEILLSGYPCYKSECSLAYLYKAPYGQAGLSAQIWKMEKGELATLNNLREKKLLKFICFLFFSFYSILKFFRRWVVSLNLRF